MIDDPEDLDDREPDELDAALSQNDVAAGPNESGDSRDTIDRLVPEEIRTKYEVISYRGAAAILSDAHHEQFNELVNALREFSITTRMIRMPGGSESEIPKVVSRLLRPRGWHETTIQGDLLVKLSWKEPTINNKGKSVNKVGGRDVRRPRYLDGHRIDYVKGKVAFDLEWNSKDQTFDRDLYAFSAFSQCGIIDVGVLLTRSESLNSVFNKLGPALKKDGQEHSTKKTRSKYGASTTWMGKLLYRLNAGRNGGCPVLALGITPKCISDWEDHAE